MTNTTRLFIVFFLISAFVLFACSTFSPQGAETHEASTPGADTPQESAPELPAQEDSPAVSTTDEFQPTDMPTEIPPTETPPADQDALIEMWRPAIGSQILLTGICEGLKETVDNQISGASSSAELSGELFAIRLFLGITEEAISEWTPESEVEAHKADILSHIDSLQELLDQWGDDALTNEQAAEQVSTECDTAMADFEAMVKEADEEGLSKASLESIVEQVQAGFEETQSEAEGEVVPIPEGVGMSRQNPVPFGEMASAPNWDIQVLEVVRGEEAWTPIQQANQFNEPALEGSEYLLVKIKAKSTADDSDEHSISNWDFNLTGSKFIQYSSASVVPPEPVLDANLFSGGETEGWLAFVVAQGEDNLVLILDEVANWDEDRYRFFALEDGAAVEVPSELSTILPNELGVDRASPAPLGEKVITGDWEVQVMDVLRGEEAWTKIQEANQFNDPAEDGMEFVLAMIKVRFIGQDLQAQNIDNYSFKSTGSNNVLYDTPSVVEPEPLMDAYLFPGGEHQGWVVLSATEGEENLIVVFQPFMDWDDTNKRFLSLEP